MDMNEAINGLSEEELDLLNSDPEMLAAFKAKYSAPQGVLGSIGEAAKKLVINPLEKSISVPMDISKKVGTGVEAGYAGLGDLVTGKGIGQAADTVGNVEAGQEPTTSSGKAGKFAGSFFTPNQIALTATGEAAAKPIVKGLGAAANAVGDFLSPVAEKTVPGAQKLASEILGPLTSNTPETLQHVMANPEAVKSAASFPQLAEQVATNMTKLDSHISGLSKAVDATLSADKMLPTQPIVDAIQKAKALAGTTGSAESEAALSNLDRLQENILKKYGPEISEVDLHKWIQAVQGETKFPGATAVETASNEAKKKAGGIVNDYLKTANPKYAAAKEPLADAINLKENLASAMGVEKAAGEPWSPKNFTVTKLKGLLDPEKSAQTQKLLAELADIPGMTDFTEAVGHTAAKSALAERAPAGYRLATLGLGSRLPALGGFLSGLVPGASKLAANAVTGATKALPSVGNAIYQGLNQ